MPYDDEDGIEDGIWDAGLWGRTVAGRSAA